MQFKQFFIVLCALTLVFSACKKDETPVLPDVTGLWKVITVTTSDCNDPSENRTENAADFACTTPDAIICYEYELDLKADETFTMDLTAFFLGQDISTIETGTYKVLSEDEVEICYSDGTCTTTSLGDDQLTMSGPDDETGCLMTMIFEQN